MINPRYELSLADKNALEREVDGPITSTHIADKIRALSRAACAAEESEDEIRADRTRHLDTATQWAAKVDSYRALLGTWTCQSTVEKNIDFYSRMFREAMDRADACDRKLDALEPLQIAAE